MRKTTRRRLRFTALFLLFLLLFFLVWLWNLRPHIRSAAADGARFLTESILTEAAGQCAREGLFSYDALMHLHYGEAGEILALKADTAMLHLLCDSLTERVDALLADSAYNQASFPLGSVLGFDLFSARGPEIRFRLATRHTLRTQAVHTLEEAGINQTMHTVSLHVQGNVTVLLAGGELTLAVDRLLPVCQTLLVGKVPSLRAS